MLLAHYVRNLDGAVDVLRDALLDNGLEPLPSMPDPIARLEFVLATCSPALQLRTGVTSVRRMTERFAVSGAAIRALAALEEGSVPASIRHDVFKAWRVPTEPAIARTVWAVWMLLRDMPIDALRTVRAIDSSEIANQIEAAAQLIGDGAS